MGRVGSGRVELKEEKKKEKQKKNCDAFDAI